MKQQALNPSEISDLIKDRIANLDLTSQAQNEGTIVSVAEWDRANSWSRGCTVRRNGGVLWWGHGHGDEPRARFGWRGGAR